MKKLRPLAVLTVVAVLVVSVLSGCSKNGVSSNPKITKNNCVSSTKELALSKENVYEIYMDADFVRSSKNLKALCKSSTFIAEVKAEETISNVEDNGRVVTTFKPTIIKTLKGKYNGGTIKTLGGIVDYTSFTQKASPEVKNLVPSESERPDKIAYIFGNIPLIQDGNSFIVFCQDQDGGYSITNTFEGIFDVEGDFIRNDAIRNTPLFKEISKNAKDSENILKDDFIKKLNI